MDKASGNVWEVPTMIDVEGSGFDADSYPVEVGLVLPDGTPHCFLLKPPLRWSTWDPDAERMHGISREVVESYGRPLEEVAWRLNGLLDGQTVYVDPMSFDPSLIGKLFDKVGKRQAFRVAPLSELLSDGQRAAWDGLREEVLRALAPRRQRASGNARILRETYLRSLSLAG